MNLSWKDFSADITLADDEVHIVIVDVSHFMGRLQHYQQLLSQTELQRSTQAVFVLARGILRELLAHYTQSDPHKIEFILATHGKPLLKHHQLQFNVSHTHGKILYIFTKNRAVGVDVEYKERKINYLKIARRFFSEKEFQYLQSLSKSDVAEAFFTLWTLKEAYAKATGEGISIFRQFSLDITSQQNVHSYFLAVLPLEEKLYQGSIAYQAQTALRKVCLIYR